MTTNTTAQLSPIERAQATIPEYAITRRKASHLRSLNLGDLTETAAHAKLRERIHELGAQGAITDEVLNGELLLLAMRAVAGATLHSAISAAAMQSREATRSLDDVHLDALLSELNNDLGEVTAALTNLMPLSDFESEAAVLESERATEYKEFQRLCQRYREIRTTQIRLTAQSAYDCTQGAGTFAAEARYICRLETAFPDQDPDAWISELVRPSEHTWVAPMAPWGTRSRLDSATVESEDFLRWAVESEVQLWIPTGDEHAEECERLRNLATPLTPDQAAQMNQESRQLARKIERNRPWQSDSDVASSGTGMVPA